MCHVFHNKMKYKLKEKEDADRRASGALSNTDDGKKGNNGNDSSDDDIVGHSNDDDSDDEPPGVLLKETTRGTVSQERLQDYIGQLNNLVEDAKTHVMQAATKECLATRR